MFELLVKARSIALAYKGVNGEDVLSNQKEVDKYRVCSGDNFTVFEPYVKFEPWHGFVAVSKHINFNQYTPCTGVSFS